MARTNSVNPYQTRRSNYYSNGNYEAFARPRKPAGVDEKSAWFVGAGLASLAGAAFMIRDGQLPGSQITIVERLDLPGGALDGIKEPKKGFVVRGGREMENHFETLWDLFRSVPSLEIDGASVLDEFYWLNKEDPNFSLQRATVNRGEDAKTDGKFGLSEKAQKEMIQIFLATREEMENKRINEVFTQDFFDSHFSALKFTKYNQYESLVLPLYTWLLDQGVTFDFSTEVTDIQFDITAGRKQATRIDWVRKGESGGVDLGKNDLVLTTIGSLTDNSDDGDHHTAAKLNRGPAPAWDLWRRIAAKDSAFGHNGRAPRRIRHALAGWRCQQSQRLM